MNFSIPKRAALFLGASPAQKVDPVLVFRTSMKHYLLENKDEQSHYLHIGI
jgi:hypothetical protein